MDIQQRLQSAKTRKMLLEKREQRIKNKVKSIEREKVNLDSTHIKTGRIQKVKIIAKKKYRSYIDKGRKIQVKIQDNANPGTYLSESSQYQTILNRTKSYIAFDDELVEKGCKAILAFAKKNKQNILNIELELKHQIQCNQCPILIKMPEQHKVVQHNAIIITNSIQDVSKLLPQNSNIKLITSKQFIEKYRNDKIFKKQIIKNLCRIFCQFKIFKTSKLLKRLLKDNFPVFPIDIRKVPFTVQQNFTSYGQYIEYLQKSCFAVVKSCKQHRIKIKREDDDHVSMSAKVKEAIWQMVARLIYKNKNKTLGGNRLLISSLKTESSIPIEIYRYQQN